MSRLAIRVAQLERQAHNTEVEDRFRVLGLPFRGSRVTLADIRALSTVDLERACATLPPDTPEQRTRAAVAGAAQAAMFAAMSDEELLAYMDIVGCDREEWTEA